MRAGGRVRGRLPKPPPPGLAPTHKADEVGAPGVPQQVRREALQGHGRGPSRGDDHVLCERRQVRGHVPGATASPCPRPTPEDRLLEVLHGACAGCRGPGKLRPTGRGSAGTRTLALASRARELKATRVSPQEDPARPRLAGEGVKLVCLDRPPLPPTGAPSSPGQSPAPSMQSPPRPRSGHALGDPCNRAGGRAAASDGIAWPRFQH